VAIGIPFHVHTIPTDYVPTVVSPEVPTETKAEIVSTTTEWDVESVQMWLHEEGFDQYREYFEEHEIDGQALRLLSEENLREMGVAIMGDRLKLMRAIRRLARSRPFRSSSPSSFRSALTTSCDSIESHRITSQHRRKERLLNSPLRTSA